MYPKALRLAVIRTIEQHGPLVLFDLKQLVLLPTTEKAIKATVENGIRHGWLEKVGSEKRPHCYKWVALYDVAQQPDAAPAEQAPGMAVLSMALSGWTH